MTGSLVEGAPSIVAVASARGPAQSNGRASHRPESLQPALHAIPTPSTTAQGRPRPTALRPASKPIAAAPAALRSETESAEPDAPQPEATSATADPAPQSTPEARAELRSRKANFLDKLMPAAYMEAILGEAAKSDTDAFTYEHLLAKVLKEAGDPVDPIERMSIEMTTFAFHKTGQLLAKAARAEHMSAVEIYNAAAAKMMAEFRRQTLALKEYRTTAGSPKLKVVGGQPDVENQQAQRTA